MLNITNKQRTIMCIILSVILAICIALTIVLVAVEQKADAATIYIEYDSDQYVEDLGGTSTYYWTVNAFSWEVPNIRTLVYYEEDSASADILAFSSYWTGGEWEQGDSGTMLWDDASIYMMFRLEYAPKITPSTWKTSLQTNYAAGYQGVYNAPDNYSRLSSGTYAGLLSAIDDPGEQIDFTKWDSLILDEVQNIYAFSVFSADGFHYISEEVCIGTVSRGKPLPVTPTKPGHTFTGWYTDSACTKPYTDSTITGNVTLYAGFTPNNYSIKFDGNGKTSGTMANQDMTYNTSANLTVNAFKRTGYEFKGWSTTPTGEVRYTDGQSVNNLTAASNGTVTLYAIWEQVTYQVHFNANGGEGSMNNQIHTAGTSKKLTTVGFERIGYYFAGWATEPEGEVVYTNCQSVIDIGTAGATVELYAVWQKYTLTMSFYGNGGEGSMQIIYLPYGETVTLQSNAFVRTGYTFLGWALSPDGEIVYKNGETITNDRTDDAHVVQKLYAVWKVNMCTVTFVVDGEVYLTVEVEYGTPTSEVVGSAVSSTLYAIEGEEELPNS